MGLLVGWIWSWALHSVTICGWISRRYGRTGGRVVSWRLRTPARLALKRRRSVVSFVACRRRRRRRGGRATSATQSHPLHYGIQPLLLLACAITLGCFDGVKKLTSFTPAVFDKGLHVFLQIFASLLHFGVELPGTVEACLKVLVRLPDLSRCQ